MCIFDLFDRSSSFSALSYTLYDLIWSIKIILCYQFNILLKSDSSDTFPWNHHIIKNGLLSRGQCLKSRSIPIIKDPQFSTTQDEIQVIFTNFHNIWFEIVDFLLMVYFWGSKLFLRHQYHFKSHFLLRRSGVTQHILKHRF